MQSHFTSSNELGDATIMDNVNESLLRDDYDNVDVYTSILTKHYIPDTFASESEPSIEILTEIKRVIPISSGILIVDKNNLLCQLNEYNLYEQIRAGHTFTTIDEPVDIRLDHITNSSLNSYYMRCYGGSFYDPYDQQFKSNNPWKTFIHGWDRFVHTDDIPIMKKIMTSTTPFTCDGNNLVIYARGMRWTFDRNLHIKTQPLISSKYSHEFTTDLMVMCNFWGYVNQSYAIYQRATNVIYYVYELEHKSKDFTELLIKFPDNYDIIMVQIWEHCNLEILVTDKDTGMLYFCTYRREQWAIISRYSSIRLWKYYMVGHLHLYSSPDLYVSNCNGGIIIMQNNRLTMLHRTKFYPIEEQFW